jgi:hypothetical protein
MRIFYIVILVILGVIVYSLLFPFTGGLSPASKTIAKNDTVNLSCALSAYKSEYGDYPQGSVQFIISSLLGSNPRKIVFIELSHSQLKNGLYIDPWGTPLNIDLTHDKPHVWSCGKNKINEIDHPKSDDIHSWD